MQAVVLCVLVARLIIPLLILKRPLAGALLAFFLDVWDWHILLGSGFQAIDAYQHVDKILDLYYLALMALVVTKWKSTRLRHIGLALFWYRALGVVLYEIFGWRVVLFLFPNMFEYVFWLIVGYYNWHRKEVRWSNYEWLIILVAILIPKLLQEYMLHILPQLPQWVRWDTIYEMLRSCAIRVW